MAGIDPAATIRAIAGDFMLCGSRPVPRNGLLGAELLSRGASVFSLGFQLSRRSASVAKNGRGPLAAQWLSLIVRGLAFELILLAHSGFRQANACGCRYCRDHPDPYPSPPYGKYQT
jgi:hypothetical protein